MKKVTALLLAMLFISITEVWAQEETNYGIKWSGFVKTDYMFDTRQTLNSREGHFMILPQAANMSNGEDLNDNPNFNILSIQTRLTGTISGPDFFGFKTMGLIEADFFGNSGTGLDDVNGFRLRHAFSKISNDKFEVLMGQFWNPMFVTDVSPGVYSFNTGVPFQPFSRNPQIRLTTKGTLKLILVAFTERDFSTRGASVQKAAVPQLHAQIHYGSKSKLLAGGGFNYKMAQNATNTAVLGTENVNSGSFIAFVSANLGKLSWKAEAVYGQNLSDVLQLSGYAINADSNFVANQSLSAWTEFQGDISEKAEWGIFVAYTQNMGYSQAADYVAGFLGNNVDYAFRLAPRIGFKSGKLTIGTELEFTRAQYGVYDATKGTIDITDVDPVDNTRVLITSIYKF